jgi:hypothetical protein
LDGAGHLYSEPRKNSQPLLASEKMGWISGVTKSAAGAAESGAASGAGKAAGKGAAGTASSGALVALAAIPVIGTTLTAVLAADTASDAFQALLDNPAALAIVGGLALFMVMK